MRELQTVLVLGTVTGLQAALLAVGIVLIYEVRRFINFAQAQLGLLGASVVGVLVLEHDLPYGPSLLAGLAVGVAVGIAVHRLLAWRLADASPTTLIIATIGVSQLLLIAVASGPLAIDTGVLVRQGYPVPFTARWDVGGYTMNATEMLTLIIGPLLVLGLHLFVTRTRVGTAIRGVASNRDAAALSGISLRRTTTIVWALAGFVSAVAAILFAPSQPASTFSAAGTALLLRGLAAAVAGGLSDFRVAFAAGIAFGIIEQGFLFWTDTPGLADLAIFVFLIAGLALRARRVAIDDRLDVVIRATRSASSRGRWAMMPVAGWAVLVIGLFVLPLLPGLGTQEKAVFLTLIVVYCLTGLSLLVLTGWGGQVSMGQFAFVGVGAFVAARLFAIGLSVPVVLLEAGMVTAVVAVLVGLPAVRMGRLFTAVCTLGFAFAAQAWLFRQSWVTGNETGYMRVARMHVLGTEIRTTRGVYVVAVAVLLAVVVLLRTVRQSPLGRMIIAVRDNQDLAGAHGIAPVTGKLLALALSGLIAGAAGALWAMATRQWTFDSFEPTMSLVLLAAAIVGSLGVSHGPILGAFAVFAWPYLVPNANTIVVRSLSSGALLLVVLLFAPGGLAGVLAAVTARVWPASRTEVVTTRERSAAPALPRPRPERPQTAGRIDARDVTKHYGGIVAVDRASVRVEPGEIVGIIGGNGAGKSTLLDCISGRQHAESGTIELDGVDVTMLTAPARAGIGLARTFQDATLYPGLTVEEAVLVAVERTNRTGAVSAALGAPWAALAEAEKRAAVADVLDGLGLLEHADRLTSELSTGMRRVCELATAVVPRPSVVLLDEPTAGLAQREVEAFAGRIRDLRDRFDSTVLIVEHDIPLLVGMCDRLYCMEQGAVIAGGDPATVVDDPRVVASCLGTDVDAITRSGSMTTRRRRARVLAARRG